MGWFDAPAAPTVAEKVAAAHAQSEAARNVFYGLAEDLRQANETALDARAEALAKIAELQAEVEAANRLVTGNVATVDKINALLG